MLLRVLALLLSVVTALPALAQPYPAKPVKIVASSLPGGGVDLVRSEEHTSELQSH